MEYIGVLNVCSMSLLLCKIEQSLTHHAYQLDTGSHFVFIQKYNSALYSGPCDLGPPPF